MPRSSPVTTGDAETVQVIRRASAILAAIAREGVDGMRLVDIARVTGIARPSVHRMLQDLLAIDYVERHSDKLHAIGPALFTLGLAAPNPIQDPILLRSLAVELAAATGDTVYVSIRHVDGVHYLMREEGQYPIRAHYIAVGDVRAYTNTYSGIVLLAHLAEAERERALAQLHLNAAADSTAAADPDGLREVLREKVAEVQRDGWFFGANVVRPGVAGLAAPILSGTSAPYMALSISAVESRLPAERLPELRARLLETAARMSGAIL
ncbi:IclR family transcriptional regulator [Herbiconiux daphne]|uniref:Helix-turn-helix domain-containing protein n=1 Tax=Herbiconiux daphne TaxID=2970914 RepID=A0ABT2H3J5_9MICO|nr:IclR family transcriptional regulator C-terminal domain-containing protein [Herbiconiux daphne]MCS5734508.1 helix-turn-helix domain-containing protein [Herbiconiux daphne]